MREGAICRLRQAAGQRDLAASGPVDHRKKIGSERSLGPVELALRRRAIDLDQTS